MLQAAPARGTNIQLHTVGRCSLGVVTTNGASDASIAAEPGAALALCGRIDNLDEVVARLNHDGPPPTAPAAIMLAAFRQFGEDVANALRGAFSVVVTDGSFIRAFRDHIGFGVLHYGQHGADVYVATESGQVLAGSGRPREPEPAFLVSLLYDRYEDETLCALKGVRRLPQGTVFRAGPNGVSWSRFWRPDELLETARFTANEVQLHFDALMTQAVSRVLTGQDVVSLSGGIESSAIAAYASPEYRRRWGRKMSALSAVYPRFPSIDERASVELLAAGLGLELHLFVPQEGPLDGLREWVKRSGGPAPSSFSRPRELYLTARELGYRTILNGNYGELATDVGQPDLVAHLIRARRLGAVRALIGAQRARGVPGRSVIRQLVRASVPVGVVDAYEHRRRQPSFGPDWLDRTRIARRAPPQVRTRGRWRQAQVASFYIPRLQVEADEMEQAATGVQVRWPWADVDLWEFFLRLPAETKYPDLQPRKLFVRRLLRGRVPDAILDQPVKTIYGDAEMQWIDYGFLRQLLRDPKDRIAGVDYARLAQHLDDEDLRARDFWYIRKLATIHLFLEEWPGRTHA
jgi:asparagine synthetase B (glutamine-hydrolysing)